MPCLLLVLNENETAKATELESDQIMATTSYGNPRKLLRSQIQAAVKRSFSSLERQARLLVLLDTTPMSTVHGLVPEN